GGEREGGGGAGGGGGGVGGRAPAGTSRPATRRPTTSYTPSRAGTGSTSNATRMPTCATHRAWSVRAPRSCPAGASATGPSVEKRITRTVPWPPYIGPFVESGRVQAANTPDAPSGVIETGPPIAESGDGRPYSPPP